MLHKMIVTVPAYFNDFQCLTTEDEGSIAGKYMLKYIRNPEADECDNGMDKPISTTSSAKQRTRKVPSRATNRCETPRSQILLIYMTSW